MSKTNAFESDWLEYIFNNNNIANIGDATGLKASPTDGNLYIALYTTSPTDTTDGIECNYGGYQRVAVARTTAGWTVATNTASNASSITFNTCLSGSNTAIAVGILADQVDTDILYFGNLDANLSISTGVQPQFITGALKITED